MSSAAVSPELFRRACALFPTGVAVLTTRASDGTPHGLTVNAFCSLSLTPPLILVAIDRACSLLDTFEKAERFAINFLSIDQQDLSVRFSQLPEGRFAGDHRALIGEVVAASIGEGDPLVFFRSGYQALE